MEIEIESESKNFNKKVDENENEQLKNKKFGTVGCVALDMFGNVFNLF